MVDPVWEDIESVDSGSHIMGGGWEWRPSPLPAWPSVHCSLPSAALQPGQSGGSQLYHFLLHARHSRATELLSTSWGISRTSRELRKTLLKAQDKERIQDLL